MLTRARPWLGTLVEIRVSATAPAALIEHGFAAIERVHRALSFHDASSELSRLNGEAAHRAVEVSPMTADVVRTALQIAAASAGAFDPTIGAALVDAGHRPRPRSTSDADQAATWRDVQFEDDGRIRFARPLWLELGGIAKGYAVDRALQALQGAGADAAVVNAGGDLALFGDTDEPIHMRDLQDPARLIRLGTLRDGAAAGSANADDAGAQFDGRSRKPPAVRRAATVIAPHCMIADALTKLVLCDPIASRPVLRRYGATACVIEADGMTHRLGVAA